MDARAFSRLEAAVQQQLALSGVDSAVEEAAEVLLAALEPSLRIVVNEVVEEAAAELEAQVPDHHIEVVLDEGEPHLRARPVEREDRILTGEYEARLTLRLPLELKARVEEAAEYAGESVNTWIVKALSSKTKKGRSPGNRVSGTFEL
jgi:hypothetical protein